MRLPADAALIVTDMQEAIDDPRWGPRNNPGAEANIAALVAAWRAEKLPIIHVRHDGNAEPPVDDAIDIFLRHGSVNRSVDGEPTSSPRFHGVSGASIWQTLPKSGGFWTPRSTLKVVGIQNANRYGEYLRATSWNSVGVLLRQAAAA
jgi:Isochorismatase family